MKTTDRNRKLYATYWAIFALEIGLLGCLLAAALRPGIGMLLAGLFVPFVGGVGAALHLFIAGNVKVHEAGEPPPKGAP